MRLVFYNFVNPSETGW